MTYVRETDVARFARFARNVFGVGIDDSDDAASLAGIVAFRDWLKSLGLPLTFEELGAKEEDIPVLVKALCRGDGRQGSISGFVTLNEEDCANIYRLMV